MKLTYEYTKQIAGIPKQETVTLWSDNDRDIFEVLREILCEEMCDPFRSFGAFKVYQRADRLTLAELLEAIRPAMLEIRGVHIHRSWDRYY